MKKESTIRARLEKVTELNRKYHEKHKCKPWRDEEKTLRWVLNAKEQPHD